MVVAILGILLGMAIFTFSKYRNRTIKTGLTLDIKNCIREILISNNSNTTQVVAQCRKSGFTKELILISENPLTLKAISGAGSVTCTYNSNSATLDCNSTF